MCDSWRDLCDKRVYYHPTIIFNADTYLQPSISGTKWTIPDTTTTYLSSNQLKPFEMLGNLEPWMADSTPTSLIDALLKLRAASYWYRRETRQLQKDSKNVCPTKNICISGICSYNIPE